MSIGYRLFILDNIDIYKLLDLITDPKIQDIIKKLIDNYGTLDGVIYFLDSYSFDKDVISILKSLGIVSEVDGKLYIIIPNLKVFKSIYTY
ncbi:MAG: hypothetical protein ACP5GJ_04095 [Nanopusillaceae archaeon]